MDVVLGFVLGQVTSFAKLGWKWWMRPRFTIEAPGHVLREEPLARHPSGESNPSVVYGFHIRNTGREVATGIRVQLTKIETRYKADEGEPTCISRCTYDLGLEGGGSEATLVPAAATAVRLGSWEREHGVIIPEISGRLPQYYLEVCEQATECRFTVVVFDDRSHHKEQTLTFRRCLPPEEGWSCEP